VVAVLWEFAYIELGDDTNLDASEFDHPDLNLCSCRVLNLGRDGLDARR
jgi:hypothetical protein